MRKSLLVRVLVLTFEQVAFISSSCKALYLDMVCTTQVPVCPLPSVLSVPMYRPNLLSVCTGCLVPSIVSFVPGASVRGEVSLDPCALCSVPGAVCSVQCALSLVPCEVCLVPVQCALTC